MWQKSSANKQTKNHKNCPNPFFIYQKHIFHNFFSINIVLSASLDKKKFDTFLLLLLLKVDTACCTNNNGINNITANYNRNKWEKIHWKSLQYQIELFISIFLDDGGVEFWMLADLNGNCMVIAETLKNHWKNTEKLFKSTKTLVKHWKNIEKLFRSTKHWGNNEETFKIVGFLKKNIGNYKNSLEKSTKTLWKQWRNIHNYWTKSENIENS